MFQCAGGSHQRKNNIIESQGKADKGITCNHKTDKGKILIGRIQNEKHKKKSPQKLESRNQHWFTVDSIGYRSFGSCCPNMQIFSPEVEEK